MSHPFQQPPSNLMNNNNNIGGGAAGPQQPNLHTPFTRTERIEQLAEIDKDIASLLTHLSSAMRALATPPNSFVSQPPPSQTKTTTTTSPLDDDQEQQPASLLDPQTAFQLAQTNFFNTIDRVGKHLDRNIYALEEAGIISLRSSGGQQSEMGVGPGLPSLSQPISSQGGLSQSSIGTAGGGDSQQQDGRGGKPLARLEPDGAGRYGRLDVGRLNLASSTLERDKEVELWRTAREFLQSIEQQRGDRMQE